MAVAVTSRERDRGYGFMALSAWVDMQLRIAVEISVAEISVAEIGADENWSRWCLMQWFNGLDGCGFAGLP